MPIMLQAFLLCKFEHRKINQEMQLKHTKKRNKNSKSVWFEKMTSVLWYVHKQSQFGYTVFSHLQNK